MFKQSFLLGALLSVFVTFCHADSSINDDYVECVKSVLENNYYCVQKIENDKIYINSEKIVPTTQGIFIDLNGYEHVFAPQISSDSSGSFIESMGLTSNKIEASNALLPMVICPHCKKHYHPQFRRQHMNNCPKKPK